MTSKNLSKLPLPGEKPVGVYRPVTHRTRPRGLYDRLLRWLSFILLVVVMSAGAWGYFASMTPVTVIVNGEPHPVRTHWRTVGGAVRKSGTQVSSVISIVPPPDTPLEPGMVILVTQARPVLVHVDGTSRELNSAELDPYAIVQQLGITLDSTDRVIVVRAERPPVSDGRNDTPQENLSVIPRELMVLRSKTILINETTSDGAQDQVSVQVAATTIGEALRYAGYVLYEGDIITPTLSQPLPDTPTPVTISIIRGKPITIEADGLAYYLRTHVTTVREALDEIGLAPTGDDILIPGPETLIQSGASIRLIRVDEYPLIETETLPYNTRFVPDPTAELDTLTEVMAGEEGILKRQFQVRYEDGLEVSRSAMGSWVAEPPKDRVIGYGTRIVLRTLDTPSGTITYWRTLRVLATSYSPLTAGSKQPGDPYFGLSGTGDPLQRGIIATDPRVIPLYSWMYVPDYGIGQSRDVGGAVKGMRIDLGYDEANLILWNSWVEIYLLLPIPSDDHLVWVLPDTLVQISR